MRNEYLSNGKLLWLVIISVKSGFSFAEIYKFLANLGGIPNAQVELALQYLQGEAWVNIQYINSQTKLKI